jgi:hypothetical protein
MTGIVHGSGDLSKPIWRWADAFQNDWAARADWSVKPYRETNHRPIVKLEGPSDIKAGAGAIVKLSLRPSADPDGDKLSYSWWNYRGPSTYKREAPFQDYDKPIAAVQVPADVKAGDTIHVIGEVTDSGKPALTRYTRVIITVRNQ